MITPGEWKHHVGGCDYIDQWTAITSEADDKVKSVLSSDYGGLILSKDDARLISAAPNLLNAAEEAMRLLELLDILSKDGVEIYKHELRGDVELYRKRILPAIKKAKGENND